MKKSVILKTISYILCILLFSIAIISSIYSYKGNDFSFKSSYVASLCLIWYLYIDHVTKNSNELKTPKKVILISVLLYSIAGLISLVI